MIWSANQLTGFYMMITLAFNELMQIFEKKTCHLPYEAKIYTCNKMKYRFP